MNKAILMGRITKELELKQTASQIPYIQFTLAVDRKFKDANGNKQTDFISCVAWRQTATFINQYFKKGSKILVSGEIQTRNYDDKNGNKVYVTEVLVDEVDFCESATVPDKKSAQIAPPVVEEVSAAQDELELPFEI